jgi:SPP1 family predicted phage head-tail adaptor
MRIGLMRHRIGVSASTLTIDSYGQSVQAWGTAITVWAKVEEIEAAESTQAEGMNTKRVLKVLCRYNAVFTSGSRVAYDGSFFNITSIINVDGLNIEMRFTAEAIT